LVWRVRRKRVRVTPLVQREIDPARGWRGIAHRHAGARLRRASVQRQTGGHQAGREECFAFQEHVL
jgi:hypothetical protein